jgi:hypothetical protein
MNTQLKLTQHDGVLKMFNNLPEAIQQQILALLEANNFPAARDLRDAFIQRQAEEPSLATFLSSDLEMAEDAVA